MEDDRLSGAATDFADKKPTSCNCCLCEMALDITILPETLKQAKSITQQLFKKCA
jgi:hypothetical protein